MMILLILLIVLIWLIFSLCQVSAIADRRMEIAFAKWLNEHPEEAQQHLNGEII